MLLVQVWLLDESLNQKLLSVSEESGHLKVNLNHQVRQLIREADCLAKIGLPLPIVTSTLLSKRDHFVLVSDSLQVSQSLDVICLS
jgi:Dynein heavy chain, N-terminal region 1.